MAEEFNLGTLYWKVEVRGLEQARGQVASAGQSMQAGMGGGGGGRAVNPSGGLIPNTGPLTAFSGPGTFSPAVAGTVSPGANAAMTRAASGGTWGPGTAWERNFASLAGPPQGPPMPMMPSGGLMINPALRAAASRGFMGDMRAAGNTQVMSTGMLMNLLFGGWEVAGAFNAASAAERFALTHPGDSAGQLGAWNKALDRMTGGPMGSIASVLNPNVGRIRSEISSGQGFASMTDRLIDFQNRRSAFNTELGRDATTGGLSGFARATQETIHGFDRIIEKARELNREQGELIGERVSFRREELARTFDERFEARRRSPGVRARTHAPGVMYRDQLRMTNELRDEMVGEDEADVRGMGDLLRRRAKNDEARTQMFAQAQRDASLRLIGFERQRTVTGLRAANMARAADITGSLSTAFQAALLARSGESDFARNTGNPDLAGEIDAGATNDTNAFFKAMLMRGIGRAAGWVGRANSVLSGIGDAEDQERNLLKLRLRGANEASALAAGGNPIGAQAALMANATMVQVDQLRNHPDHRVKQMAGTALQTGMNQLRALQTEAAGSGFGFGTSNPFAVNFRGQTSNKSVEQLLQEISTKLDELKNF